MEKVYRRLAFGCVWFFAFYAGVGALGSGLAGGLAANQQHLPDGPAQQRFGQAYQIGLVAEHEFERRFRRTVMIAAIVFASVGTLTGILPGTKRK